MPWMKGEYPPSYKKLPAKIRNKAVEIANALLLYHGADEHAAIALGAHSAKEWAKKQPSKR
ncbi:hypothetical protein BEL04_12530 [Mucilaginibacter sp. PPCGB 2223]|uniref:hypothetical protein n=1 Tax=Mucilaginibacter sp. PPCGB 2223 TaxID=1886027 RepID=UPI000824C6AF|nr:hypothetical protein [Mucilaginibacter sp. PPCGB 2223]OCX52296.1 hypothetical protein BEL04_12530 [Mucilaginibacter sp. PPCGB 2223]